jgi:two-component system, LytTR family, sensor kinase
MYLAYLPGLAPAERQTVMFAKGVRSLLGFAASFLLLGLYRRVLARRPGVGALAGSAIAACIAMGIVCMVAYRRLLVLLGLAPVGMPRLEWATLPRDAMDFVFLLMAWSAAYFAVRLWGAWQAREREATEARRLAQEAQLQMLAYQLNPHFLFNALNSIRAMIEEDRGKARQMVTQLADFLRYSLLARPLREAKLGDELEALEGYLAIEQIRFEDRLRLTIEIAPETRECVVPAFLLHPLVENAIKHGRHATSDEPLAVRVAAAIVDGRLRVEIANTGVLGASQQEGTGLGLRNVEERLTRMYDGRHRLAVVQDGAWVRATIELPARAHA